MCLLCLQSSRTGSSSGRHPLRKPSQQEGANTACRNSYHKQCRCQAGGTSSRPQFVGYVLAASPPRAPSELQPPGHWLFGLAGRCPEQVAGEEHYNKLRIGHIGHSLLVLGRSNVLRSNMPAMPAASIQVNNISAKAETQLPANHAPSCP